MAIFDPITRVPWLLRGIGGRILFAIVLHLRALVDCAVAAVKMRFPGHYTAETLPLIGRDRRIRRGRVEPDATYANRLIQWWDVHKRRGGPFALLEQLHAFYAPNNFPIELVYVSGRRFSLGVSGEISIDDIEWTPPNPEQWARWWLFYHWPEPILSDGLWDDPGVWDDGGVWDSNLTVSQVDEIKLIPTEFNAAHAFGHVVLISGDGELWDYPLGEWDEPGGVWGADAAAVTTIEIR